MQFEEIRQVAEDIICVERVGKTEKCMTSTGHIEVELFSKDTQEYRKIADAKLHALFPKKKFRFIMYKA